MKMKKESKITSQDWGMKDHVEDKVKKKQYEGHFQPRGIQKYSVMQNQEKEKDFWNNR